MTKQEREIEWAYLYQERLGIMCGADEPTPEQDRIARQIATEQLKQLVANES